MQCLCQLDVMFMSIRSFSEVIYAIFSLSVQVLAIQFRMLWANLKAIPSMSHLISFRSARYNDQDHFHKAKLSLSVTLNSERLPLVFWTWQANSEGFWRGLVPKMDDSGNCIPHKSCSFNRCEGKPPRQVICVLLLGIWLRRNFGNCSAIKYKFMPCWALLLPIELCPLLSVLCLVDDPFASFEEPTPW